MSRITTVIHYSSTTAASRRSEIGRTSISGSFSLLLSFGETKERRERNLPGGKAYHSFLFLEKKKRSKYSDCVFLTAETESSQGFPFYKTLFTCMHTASDVK